MVDALKNLLEQTPMLALFVAVGLGYALGRISIAGFSLGVGAVLFAGLALGALAPGAAPPALVNSIGLAMFLYGIGIQYGKAFFAGFGGAGLKWNALSAAGVLGALAVAVALGAAAGVSPAYSMGLFAGSLTSTPTLQAALDAAKNGEPAIGYSVAYPFGVFLPILCIYLFARLLKSRLAPAPEPLAPMEVTLRDVENLKLADLLARLPAGVELLALRRGGENRLPAPELVLDSGDAVLLLGAPAALETARMRLGRAEPGRLAKDRSALDVARFFVSREALVGTAVGEVVFPDGVEAKIGEVRRGDAVLHPSPDLVLEFGDRVGVVAPRESLPALRRFFGDSLKSTAEFSHAGAGVGMALGVLVGLVSIPVPGLGAFSLGIAGGPLVVALILGRLGRTGPLSWHVPLAANLTLRNFGLALFLAGVGLGAGRPFVDTVSRTGLTFLGIGAAIVLGGVLLALLVGHFVLRMPTDDLFGVVSGVTGNPAIPAFANRTLESDRIDLAFATVFPSMTILKILCAQIAMAILV